MLLLQISPLITFGPFNAVYQLYLSKALLDALNVILYIAACNLNLN